MSVIGPSLALCLVLAADGAPAPKLPPGKDTTYVTGPLDKDGYIDYEAALNDRLGKGVTPETNANVLIWKALGPTPEGGQGSPPAVFKRLGIDEPPKDGAYFISLGAFMRDHLKLDPSEFEALAEEQALAGKRPWAAKDHPHIAAWLEANEKPMALIVEATRRPDYYNPLISRHGENEPGSLIGALLPSVQKCRELATALTARAMLRVQEGKFDDAWQDLLACHRLGRLVARGGTLIEALVGFAIDLIASNADLAYLERADLTAAQARDRLKDLQALPPMPPLADKIDVCERFEYLDCVEMVRRGGVGVLEGITNGKTPPKPDADAEKALAAIDWTPALRDGNAMYDRIAAAMRLKDRAERERELDRVEQNLKALKVATSSPLNVAPILLGKDPPEAKAGKAIGNILIILLVPAVRKVQQAYDRDEQVQRNVQIAFALAGYHRDHGAYPATLDDLAPKYLETVPDDLFSGAALVYRPTGKGYLFYSVGVNGKDEGGRSRDDDPAGDDLPVAMPLPALKPKK